MRRATTILQFASAICVFGGSAPLLAQLPDGEAKNREQGAAATPCCGVVAVDARARIVTAREMATGYTFRFKVHDRRFMEFQVGRKLWADFAAKQIWLSPPGPVAITWLPPAPAAGDTIRKPSRSNSEHKAPEPHDRSTILRSAT